MKTKEKIKAIKLRQEGYSLKNIAAQIGVSKSTVSIWCQKVEIPEDKLIALNTRNPAMFEKRSELFRNQRLLAQDQGRRFVKDGNMKFIALCMLYWGEGSKNQNSFIFTNSDGDMIKLVKQSLDECFDLSYKDYAVSLNVFTDIHSESDCEKYWLDLLNLDKSCLRKGSVNNYPKSSNKKKTKKLEYGVCRLVIHQTRIVQAVYGGIQELTGRTRSEWLG